MRSSGWRNSNFQDEGSQGMLRLAHVGDASTAGKQAFHRSMTLPAALWTVVRLTQWQ